MCRMNLSLESPVSKGLNILSTKVTCIRMNASEFLDVRKFLICRECSLQCVPKTLSRRITHYCVVEALNVYSSDKTIFQMFPYY